ncbi:hypothetical protein [Bradyrhizobium murdochi]|nr:hypothetical protein [Bradyrhizobium murdochi]
MTLTRLILMNALTRFVLGIQVTNINVAVAAHFSEPSKRLLRVSNGKL